MVYAIDWEECRRKEREACAQIADDMARDLEDRAKELTAGRYTAEQVITGYRLIAKLIRARKPQ